MPSSTVAVTGGAAPGVMPAQVLGGPIWWFIFGVYVLALGLSLFVVFDSFRPKRQERLTEIPEPRWLYPVIEGVFALMAVAVWIPGIPRIASVAPVVAFPFALGFAVAYLLRVVFPKPREGSSVDSGDVAGDEEAAP